MTTGGHVGMLDSLDLPLPCVLTFRNQVLLVPVFESVTRFSITNSEGMSHILLSFWVFRASPRFQTFE